MLKLRVVGECTSAIGGLMLIDLCWIFLYLLYDEGVKVPKHGDGSLVIIVLQDVGCAGIRLYN